MAHPASKESTDGYMTCLLYTSYLKVGEKVGNAFKDGLKLK